MRASISRLLRSDVLPAALIVLALGAFVALASRAKGDLRLVSSEIDADLLRAPLAAPAAPAAVDPSKRGALRVRVAGIRSDAGKISVALFQHGPLTEGSGIISGKVVPAAPGDVEVAFDDVPQGVYAVVAYHDENGNGRVDMKGSGGGPPPAEGIGNSNAEGPLMAPPSWDDSRFVLDKDALEVKVRLFYY